MGECLWPSCDHAGQISADGGKTVWCWCHVEVPVAAVDVGHMATCRRCNTGTVHEVDGDPMHPRCYRPWLLARAASAL